MANHEVPGVHIEEVPRLPPPIVDVDSAVPAFIGYTVTATNAATDDLRFKPTLVRSMRDVEEFFGDSGTRGAVVHISTAGGAPVVGRVDDPTEYHPLHFALQLFFENGGRRCYVVSVGARGASKPVALAELVQGVDMVALEDEVTLVVVPEASSLAVADYSALVTSILAQCAQRRDRFAIFDLYDGRNEKVDLASARACFADSSSAKFGAVYYPHLRTTIPFPYVETARDAKTVSSNASVRLNGASPVDVATLIGVNQAVYDVATAALRGHRVTMPPSAAVAGVYVATDLSRGVWKASANVALQAVTAPVVAIDDRRNDELTLDASTGRSVNAIRSFAGRGTLVWGARTLAGSDAEWRYVPVRRFMSVLEKSIVTSTAWVTFEPNDATTWVKLRGAVESYLVTKWKAGALVGSTPRDAFFVRVGLGQTMTAQDIADGRLILEIGVALVRPAEFVIIRIGYRVPPP